MALGNGAVIVGAARTPIGKLLGALSDFKATDLGGIAIKAVLERAQAQPTDVDYVIMGQVLQAGAGQIPARQAAVKAGIPMSVPALTINKVCLSGLDAIALADQLIRAGEFETIVAGGMESMTNAPHLLPNARKGFKFGSTQLIDAMAFDGLTDPFDHLAMGESTERHNAKLNISGQGQDIFAVRSPHRAPTAGRDGSSTPRSRRSRSRSSAAKPSSSTRTKASAPKPPSKPSPSSSRLSVPTAPSLQVVLHRYRTAPQLCLSLPVQTQSVGAGRFSPRSARTV